MLFKFGHICRPCNIQRLPPLSVTGCELFLQSQICRLVNFKVDRLFVWRRMNASRRGLLQVQLFGSFLLCVLLTLISNFHGPSIGQMWPHLLVIHSSVEVRSNCNNENWVSWIERLRHLAEDGHGGLTSHTHGPAFALPSVPLQAQTHQLWPHVTLWNKGLLIQT